MSVILCDYLAFDQALGNTGVVAVKDGDVLWRKTITTAPNHAGTPGSLDRSVEYADLVDEVFGVFKPRLVLVETPPVGRGMHRPESSLLAAAAICICAHRWGVPWRAVSAQKAKKLLAGNAKATKHEVRAAVEVALPGVGKSSPYNEHIVDALALVLCAMDQDGVGRVR